ncbi:MAG: glycine oxidase ThiO [Candidatus Omnitrophica bacterium]|nr:glycine oxidase ThiO [Candidatus Omnitrophota bacterium]
MGSARTDVIVLGGGIIGCALAEELGRHGQRVLVIERGRIGAEASSAAAGILSAQMDLPEPGPFFELCQASRRMYPRWIEHLERRSGMSVEYHVDGILYLAMTGREERLMEARRRWQAKRGLRVERWSANETRRHEPAVDGRPKRGFFFPTEAQVDNVALMGALAAACRKADVTLLEQTAARRVLVRERAVRGVETDRGMFEARAVVNCLGSWAAMDGAFPVEIPIEPARGQMLVFRGPRRLLRHTVMSERAYMVQRRDGRLLVGSTIERAGFEKTLTFDGIHAMLSGLRQMSSALSPYPFLEAWAGFRPYTKDALPILGTTAVEELYLATGHFRHGILLAPITATILAELILRSRTSFDLAPFSLSRFQQPSSAAGR